MNPVKTISETETVPVALTERERRMEELLQRLRSKRGADDLDALLELTDLLPETDGEPLESPWHLAAINLMIETLTWHWRDRNDFYVGGNMFVYYTLDELPRPQFKGPDFFYVGNVERHRPRDKWAVWAEGGRYPELIIEFLSESTAEIDLGPKKEIYEAVFHTAEYFCYDPVHYQLQGWRLSAEQRYEPLVPNEQGWLWSSRLQLWLGNWHGVYRGHEDTWPRCYDVQGQLVQLGAEAEAQRAKAEAERADAEAQRADVEAERADAEAQRADAEAERAAAEAQRATALEEEVAQLKARLAALEQKLAPPDNPA